MRRGKDSPIDRLRSQGIRAASPVDLIAVALSRRADDADGAETMAREMLQRRFGKIVKIAELSFDDLHREAGLEEFEAMRCLASMELGRRAALAEKGKNLQVEMPEDIYELLEHLRFEKQEHFYVILLDAKNQVIREERVHIGTLSMSIVGPREVFRIAIREGASSIIVAHNHPSGDPTPSREDIEVTQRLVEVGRLLDIPVIDHIIIGDPASVSFSRRGLI
ncbi:MAG TPA: DNA repair protein RadC [Fimbriimonadaceae bacterium]|nr:DNA repair protein RadC [Fimbriimonadaceae bacterium]